MLITIAEATAVLGLKSRGSVYRKVQSGELPSVKAADGSPRIEREGLEEAWASITRLRSDSPQTKRWEREKKKALRSGVLQAVIPDQIPDYNESRARHEYEKANLAELERKRKASELLDVKEVEKVWANSVSIARTKLLAIPTRLKQRIPHLTHEEIAIADDLIRECLEEISAGGGGNDA